MENNDAFARVFAIHRPSFPFCFHIFGPLYQNSDENFSTIKHCSIPFLSRLQLRFFNLLFVYETFDSLCVLFNAPQHGKK